MVSILLLEDIMKILCIGDLHIPFQDNKAVECIYEFLKYFRPSYIVILGDFVDFYAISRYDREPERLNSLNDEIEQGKEILNKIRMLTSCNIIWLEGNHEGRWKKFVYRRAPELACVFPSFSEIFNLHSFKIDFVEDLTKRYVTIDNYLFRHGDEVASMEFSGRYLLKKYLKKGVSGHSHRLSTVRLRTFDQQLFWSECGCLCKLTPSYCSFPNWQQGFVYIWDEYTGQIQIQDGNFVFPHFRKRLK